jgi:hypothetical protein
MTLLAGKCKGIGMKFTEVKQLVEAPAISSLRRAPLERDGVFFNKTATPMSDLGWAARTIFS